MINDSTQYIARISYGKDSLKMLDVIKSRGLPLDRITTTDVWATDTISANLPPMMAFKDRMDQRIWDMYRIEVEHLCALNKDGSKRTYEQMFYHIPVRRSQKGSKDGHSATRWCDGVNISRAGQRPNGFPVQISPWCRKLKIDKVRTPSPLSAPRGAKTEISWNTSALPLTSLPGSDSLMRRRARRWWSSALTRICADFTANMRICCPPPMKPPAGMAAGSAIIRVWISCGFCGGITHTTGRC